MIFFLPFFAFLIVLASWAAWRRSPLYSPRVALKILALVLLIVATFIGIGKLNVSTNTLTILLVVMVVVVGVGATALIIRITDGHIARLPPSARIIATHRHKIQRWILRVGVLILLCAASAFVLRASSWAALPLSFGGLALVGAGPSLMALYMRARRLDLGMSAVLANPWAHWQYTPAQWQDWAKNQLEWERSKVPSFSWKSNGRSYVVTSLSLALVFLGCAWYAVRGTAIQNIAVAVASTLAVLLLMFGINWFNRTNCDRRYRRLLAAPPETYLGSEGMFCNGEYSQWTFSGSYLVEAVLIQDAPVRIIFVFQTFDGTNSIKVARRAAVPAGTESDLQLIQQNLRATCRTASVHLSAPVPVTG